MKITTDQALDMLPAVAELMEKIDVDNMVKKSRKKFKADKEKDPEELYIDAVSFVVKETLKNAKAVKEELFEIVAIAQNASVESIREQSIGKTIKTVKDIFNDEEILDLFKSAM